MLFTTDRLEGDVSILYLIEISARTRTRAYQDISRVSCMVDGALQASIVATSCKMIPSSVAYIFKKGSGG